jgi:hypothetical protein
METKNTQDLFAEDHKPEYPISFKREDLDSVLRNPNHTAADILSLFEKDFKKTFDYPVVVSAGKTYSLAKHTAMVMGQFEKYFKGKNFPCGVESDFFEVILALHDIGKPEAIEETRDKEMQHEYTKKIMKSTLSQLGYGEKEISIATALIEEDSIGGYIQYGDANTSAKDIVRIAEEHGLEKNDFLELLTVLFCVDAGGYTKDAGGSEFSSTNSLFVFNSEKGEMVLSPDVKRRYDILVKKVREWKNK